MRAKNAAVTKNDIAAAEMLGYHGRHMKPVCRFALFLLLSLAIAPLGSAAPKAAPAPEGGVVNRIAATVNGRPITAAEVRARISPYFRELMMLYPKQGPRFNSELVKAKKSVLDDLIDRELVLSEFENKGYMMKEDHVDQEINRRILMQFNGDRDAFLDSLRKSGMTYSEYRDSVRKEVTVSAMRSSRYERGIPPTPDEIQQEYNESKADYRDIMNDAVRFDKIFIPSLDELPDEQMTEAEYQAKAEAQYRKAESLKQQIESGKISFAEAAREYSRDAHAADGGAWPLLKRTDLAVEFANVVFSAEPGKVIGPLLDNAGFTLVRVREKRLAPAPPLSNPEVKQKVDDAVRRKQSEKRYREWVDRLREKAVIRVFI